MKSDFAKIDILTGRGEMKRRLKAGERVVLNIQVRLDNDPTSWNDDGVSTEFSAVVLSLKEIKDA